MKKIFRHSQFTATFTDEDGYFSFTGDISGSSGSIGDKIVEIDPRFALMNAMHLSNAKIGEPMHAIENGKYHAKKADVVNLARLWRISSDQATDICSKVVLVVTMTQQTAQRDLDETVRKHKAIAASVQQKTKADGKKTVYDIQNVLKDLYKDAGFEYPKRYVEPSSRSLKDDKDDLVLMITKKIRDLERSFVSNAVEKAADDVISEASVSLGLVEKWRKEATKVRRLAESILVDLIDKFVDPLDEYKSYIDEKYEDAFDGFEDDVLNKIIALAKFEDVDVLEVGTGNVDDNEFEVSGKTYLVLTDDEADKKATDYIRESLWAFNADFLAFYTGMPTEMFEAVQPQCEGANDAVIRCVERAGSVEDFAAQAIRADGRGHFLSPYDGREDEETVDGETYYIYRQ